MTLVQLKHFVALAELGSFVAAAKMVFVTQPALTRSIRALEEELGQALFDRIGRRIEITAFGAQALSNAHSLVQNADNFKRLAKQALAGEVGRVRVGLSSGPGAVLAVPLLRHMTEHHPNLRIEISRGSTDRLLDALRDRQLDSAIVDIRAMRPANDLVVTHQVEMAASFLCRPGHPLIRSAGKVTFEEVLNYPLASTPLSDEVARVLTERYGPQANPDDCVTLRSDDTQTLIAVARETDAIVLTINAAGKDLHRLEMMPPLNATARFGLVSLNRHAQAPAMAIIGKLLHAVLHD